MSFRLLSALLFLFATIWAPLPATDPIIAPEDESPSSTGSMPNSRQERIQEHRDRIRRALKEREEQRRQASPLPVIPAELASMTEGRKVRLEGDNRHIDHDLVLLEEVLGRRVLAFATVGLRPSPFPEGGEVRVADYLERAAAQHGAIWRLVGSDYLWLAPASVPAPSIVEDNPWGRAFPRFTLDVREKSLGELFAEWDRGLRRQRVILETDGNVAPALKITLKAEDFTVEELCDWLRFRYELDYSLGFVTCPLAVVTTKGSFSGLALETEVPQGYVAPVLRTRKPLDGPENE